MKKTFVFLCMVLSVGCTAQTITNYYNSNWKKTSRNISTYYCELVKMDTVWKSVCYYTGNNKRFNESFYFDSDYKRPVGIYVEYDSSGEKTRWGNYLNDKQHGLWVSWHPGGKIKDSIFYSNGIPVYSRGFTENGQPNETTDTDASGKTVSRTYWPDGRLQQEGEKVNGLREGLWKVYVPDLSLVQEVRFKKDSVISVHCIVSNGKTPKNCIYEREAEFRGGATEWRNYLTKKLTKYSSKHYDEIRNGSVLVQFIVDAEGRVIEPKVVYSTDHALDPIAIQFILDSPKWTPAVQFNRNVKAYRQQPLTFVKQ
jgi:antitoxin component YwqK of YwqJK toxin-antitoxin module